MIYGIFRNSGVLGSLDSGPYTSSARPLVPAPGGLDESGEPQPRFGLRAAGFNLFGFKIFRV